MGIFAVDDMGGIDLAWRVRQEYRHLDKPGERVPLVLDKLYEMGRWGRRPATAGIATTRPQADSRSRSRRADREDGSRGR